MRRRRACSPRSATASCSSTATAACGSGTRPPSGSPGSRKPTCSDAASESAVPGWETIEPRLPVARAGEAGRAESVPLEIGSRELWLSVSAVGYEDGTVYAFRDLTEERALETMRQDIVATVSHELRTPLAAIYGAALTLRRDDVELEAQLHEKLLEVITEESDRLAEIVNDLLLASQLDTGKIEARTSSVATRTRSRSSSSTRRGRICRRTSTLALDAPTKLPAVAADSGQLRQVLSNLIENAIKYSPHGGTVKVALTPNGRNVRFSVTDSGLGIPRGRAAADLREVLPPRSRT